MAQGILGLDDDQVRVTTWTFEKAGDATGRHRHEFDHDVVYAGEREAVFVEIELKR